MQTRHLSVIFLFLLYHKIGSTAEKDNVLTKFVRPGFLKPGSSESRLFYLFNRPTRNPNKPNVIYVAAPSAPDNSPPPPHSPHFPHLPPMPPPSQPPHPYPPLPPSPPLPLPQPGPQPPYHYPQYPSYPHQPQQPYPPTVNPTPPHTPPTNPPIPVPTPPPTPVPTPPPIQSPYPYPPHPPIPPYPPGYPPVPSPVPPSIPPTMPPPHPYPPYPPNPHYPHGYPTAPGPEPAPGPAPPPGIVLPTIPWPNNQVPPIIRIPPGDGDGSPTSTSELEDPVWWRRTLAEKSGNEDQKSHRPRLTSSVKSHGKTSSGVSEANYQGKDNTAKQFFQRPAPQELATIIVESVLMNRKNLARRPVFIPEGSQAPMDLASQRVAEALVQELLKQRREEINAQQRPDVFIEYQGDRLPLVNRNPNPPQRPLVIYPANFNEAIEEDGLPQRRPKPNRRPIQYVTQSPNFDLPNKRKPPRPVKKPVMVNIDSEYDEMESSEEQLVNGDKSPANPNRTPKPNKYETPTPERESKEDPDDNEEEQYASAYLPSRPKKPKPSKKPAVIVDDAGYENENLSEEDDEDEDLEEDEDDELQEMDEEYEDSEQDFREGESDSLIKKDKKNKNKSKKKKNKNKQNKKNQNQNQPIEEGDIDEEQPAKRKPRPTRRPRPNKKPRPSSRPPSRPISRPTKRPTESSSSTQTVSPTSSPEMEPITNSATSTSPNSATSVSMPVKNLSNEDNTKVQGPNPGPNPPGTSTANPELVDQMTLTSNDDSSEQLEETMLKQPLESDASEPSLIDSNIGVLGAPHLRVAYLNPKQTLRLSGVDKPEDSSESLGSDLIIVQRASNGADISNQATPK